MADGIEGLQASARRHSKRASNYFAESRAILELEKDRGLRPEQVAAALALNKKAIEEFSMAINTIQFLNRYLGVKEH